MALNEHFRHYAIFKSDWRIMDWRRIFVTNPGVLERWEKERTKGLLRFLLVRGVVGYGLVMYVAIAAVMYFTGWNTLVRYGRWREFEKLMLWAVAGMVFGLLGWFTAEFFYASHRRKPIRF